MEGRGPAQDHPPPWTCGAQLPVPSPRRSSSYIVCNTTSWAAAAAAEAAELRMKVMVQVDRAKIHRDLFFEYKEDPTIVRIEPEWSIMR